MLILFLLPYVLSVIICVGIGIYAFYRWSLPGALAFGLLAAAEAGWTLGYIFQTLAPDLGGKLFWNNIQFIGAVTAPLGYLAFGLSFTGKTFGRIRLILGGFALADALLLIFIWTDNLHHLFRTAPHLVQGNPFSLLVYGNGPGFGLYPFLGYLAVIIGTAALGINYISAPRVFRLQIGTVLVGILIPWLTTLVTWQNWVPLNLHDVTPLSFAVSNLVVALALFRFRLFDLAPVTYKTLVDNMDDGVIVLDHLFRIVDMNRSAQAVTGLDVRGATGRPAIEKLPFLQPLPGEQQSSGIFKKEVELNLGGEPRRFEMNTYSLLDNRQVSYGWTVVLRDITERKQADERLRIMAITDSLTGVYNRHHFYSIAEHELERSARSGQPVSILMFDIDHFKLVNDNYGHLAGDQVLQQLAARCKGLLRRYDEISRYGGEEFIILLPETDADQACLIGGRLREAIAVQPFETNGGPICVTISMGVACCFPEGGHASQPCLPFDQLLNRADQAMYRAKAEGRNKVCLWN